MSTAPSSVDEPHVASPRGSTDVFAPIGSHPADATLVDLLPADHLPDCPRAPHTPRRLRPGDGGPSCEWCVWSWVTPVTRGLMSIEHDARVLRAHDDPGVATVVAWRRLLDLRDQPTGDLRRRSHDESVEAAGRLLQRVDSALGRDSGSAAWSPGDAVSRTLLETAAVIAVSGCAPAGERHRLHCLPPSLGVEVGKLLDALPDDLSATTQVGMMLPMVDLRLDRPLPALWTQPEWQRRHHPQSDPLRSAGVAEGSLEALVLERLLVERTEQVLALAPRLLDDATTVPVRRAVTHPGGSARTLTWRITPVDWHATWVDALGLPDDSPTEEQEVTEVPWFVAIAIDLATEQGRRSLLAPPEMERR